LAGRSEPDRTDVIAGALTGEGSGLESLAEALRISVPDEALVASPALRGELEGLMLRCRLRDDLVDGLGASAVTRYRPGVRALFSGLSGTGKTLAAGWVATRLGLPLYRVDLASVTSKYIGETEKNLSQLLARAEGAEVILLFDEADSLFGKRTDIQDSNDRFANAQTNYLLQRIENYDGIVILTSNSQSRFDAAFSRRLDFVIEFPLPGPEERRALWRSHLGPRSTLTPAQLNQIALLVDVSGGHVRNAVLSAAVRARRDGREIGFGDLLAGIEGELRKLGRQVPVELRAASLAGDKVLTLLRE
jgi:SpoVK/Ycf46/Vps4 family AAA+-type ATPase